MNKTCAWLVVAGLLFPLTSSPSEAAKIWLDADPDGTGKSVNIQRAVYDSGTDTVTHWGDYRDYRFQLAASPQATLNDFGLRLSVNKSSAFSAPLNVTWFADSITPYAADPDFSTALGTVSANDLPTGAFAAYVIEPGPYKVSLTVPSSKTAYWVRLWAATSGGNDKYQTKLADNVDLEFASTASNLTMYNYNESSGQFTTTAAAQTTNITPVPEPTTAFLTALGLGTVALQRRWKRASQPRV